MCVEEPDDFCCVSAKKSDAAQERTPALGPTAQPRPWNSTSGRRVRDDFVNSSAQGCRGGGWGGREEHIVSTWWRR